MKEKILALDISGQPNDTTCGPTCLHAVYNYLDSGIELTEVIESIEYLEDGGTLAVMLGIDALKRGFDAEIITFNLSIFDPSWFSDDSIDISSKLEAQLRFKNDPKFIQATIAYLKFLKLGGRLSYKTLNEALIHDYLSQEIPILTGLSATYLYDEMREIGSEPVRCDDLAGHPSGHFVVLAGFDPVEKTVKISDPLQANAYKKQNYTVATDHLICAILLGILTYDANLLIIQKK